MDGALDRLRAYRAAVFDLDGTLVRLDVDWAAVQRAMAGHASERLGRDFRGASVWEMLRDTEGSARDALEGILRRHELQGARTATRLPGAGLLSGLDGPVGVVTLNAREAARQALERTRLADRVDVLVAREDAGRLKPDPLPLQICLEGLGVPVSEAVFVGDRERDRVTAQRAGVAFLLIHDLLP